MLRYWTAGESHGKTMLAMVDGFPAGLQLETDSIDHELRRRQGGYGRGGRQRIETDTVEILTGVWQQTTLGSPIALQAQGWPPHAAFRDGQPSVLKPVKLLIKVC